jgi:hypothetical protein
MFVSKPTAGVIFSAERSDRSTKLRWSATPISAGPTTRIEAADVPRAIRVQAYKLFEGDRIRAQRVAKRVDWDATLRGRHAR